MYFFINNAYKILLQTYSNSIHVQRKKAIACRANTKLINMPLFNSIVVRISRFAGKYPLLGTFL